MQLRIKANQTRSFQVLLWHQALLAGDLFNFNTLPIASPDALPQGLPLSGRWESRSFTLRFPHGCFGHISVRIGVQKRARLDYRSATPCPCWFVCFQSKDAFPGPVKYCLTVDTQRALCRPHLLCPSSTVLLAGRPRPESYYPFINSCPSL